MMTMPSKSSHPPPEIVLFFWLILFCIYCICLCVVRWNIWYLGYSSFWYLVFEMVHLVFGTVNYTYLIFGIFVFCCCFFGMVNQLFGVFGNWNGVYLAFRMVYLVTTPTRSRGIPLLTQSFKISDERFPTLTSLQMWQALSSNIYY